MKKTLLSSLYFLTILAQNTFAMNNVFSNMFSTGAKNAEIETLIELNKFYGKLTENQRTNLLEGYKAIEEKKLLEAKKAEINNLERRLESIGEQRLDQVESQAEDIEKNLTSTKRNIDYLIESTDKKLSSSILGANRVLNELKDRGVQGIRGQEVSSKEAITFHMKREIAQGQAIVDKAIKDIDKTISTQTRLVNELVSSSVSTIENIAKNKQSEITDYTNQLKKNFEADLEKTGTFNQNKLEAIGKALIKTLKEKYNLTQKEAAEESRRFTLEMFEKKVQLKRDLLKGKKDIADIKSKTAVESAKVTAEVKAAAQKDNFVNIQSAKTKREREKIKQQFEELTKMLNDGKTVRKLAFATGLTITGVLTVKYLLPLLRKKLEDMIFTPDLIDDSSYTGFAGYFTSKALPDQQLVNLFFNPKLKEQVDRAAKVLRNTSKNNGYYLNYLFYGEPGTGKTATARALAYESGMDYAIMSGGNVQKLLKSGKAEQKLKDVFNWAKKSKNGLLLFIDEADAFLKDPTKHTMSDELYAVLNSFLNMTGTESKKISLIMSTNHPNNLPKAVLDRVGPGQFIYFGLPEQAERLRIATHFVNKYLQSYFTGTSEEESEKIKQDVINYIANKTAGFSGRNISYLILAIEKALQAEGMNKITKDLVDRIVDEAALQQNAAKGFRSFASTEA